MFLILAVLLSISRFHNIIPTMVPAASPTIPQPVKPGTNTPASNTASASLISRTTCGSRASMIGGGAFRACAMVLSVFFSKQQLSFTRGLRLTRLSDGRTHPSAPSWPPGAAVPRSTCPPCPSVLPYHGVPSSGSASPYEIHVWLTTRSRGRRRRCAQMGVLHLGCRLHRLR